MSVVNAALWCGAPVNVWLSLRIFLDIAHLHMQIKGVKQKNPTSFSLSEVRPSTVYKPKIVAFLTHLRPWAVTNHLLPSKNGIFKNSS